MDKAMAEQDPAIPKQEKFGLELIAGLAHTIKTPLQSIIINSEMLMEILEESKNQRLRKRGSRILSRIHSEADSLQMLLNDFLALWRIVPGKKTPTNINALIREIVEFLRNECLRSKIDISLNLDNSVYPVLIDRTLFSHSLMNLIVNAREAIGHDGIIEITTREAGKYLEIEISDDGPGIRLETESKVFTPFFSTKPGGSGLGLPIAKRIAEAHGGGIFVMPSTGRGATFVLRLPKGKFLTEPGSTEGLYTEITFEDNEGEQ